MLEAIAIPHGQDGVSRLTSNPVQLGLQLQHRKQEVAGYELVEYRDQISAVALDKRRRKRPEIVDLQSVEVFHRSTHGRCARGDEADIEVRARFGSADA